jgi:hypothetical protein
MLCNRVSSKVCGVVFAVTMVAGLAGARASAQTADERTFFTFNGPVELPGVALAPGQYMFRLPAPDTAHSVVQVVSADGKKVYGMFFTLPIQRSTPPDKPEIRFLEAAPGAPPAIRTWWHPDDSTGFEFIYPKVHARRLAKNARGSVLTTRGETTRTEHTNTADLSRVNSNGQETPVTSGITTAETTPPGSLQLGESAPQSVVVLTVAVPVVMAGQVSNSLSGTVAPRQSRSTLPQTASTLPVAGLMALCLLAAATALRLWRTGVI